MVDILKLFPEGNNKTMSLTKLTEDVYFFNDNIFNKDEILISNVGYCKYLGNGIILYNIDVSEKYGKFVKSYYLYNIYEKEYIVKDYNGAHICEKCVFLFKDNTWDVYFIDSDFLYEGGRLGFRELKKSLVYDITNNKIIDENGKAIFDINDVKLKHLNLVYSNKPDMSIKVINITDSSLIKIVYINNKNDEELYYMIITTSGEIVYENTSDINFK